MINHSQRIPIIYGCGSSNSGRRRLDTLVDLMMRSKENLGKIHNMLTTIMSRKDQEERERQRMVPTTMELAWTVLLWWENPIRWFWEQADEVLVGILILNTPLGDPTLSHGAAPMHAVSMKDFQLPKKKICRNKSSMTYSKPWRRCCRSNGSSTIKGSRYGIYVKIWNAYISIFLLATLQSCMNDCTV